MRIAILTTSEPVYYPQFFQTLLESRGEDVAGVFLLPTRRKGRSRGLVWQFNRFRRSFGLLNAMRIARRVAAAKVADALHLERLTGRPYSIQAAARRCGVQYEVWEDANAPAFLERLRALDVDLILSVSCPQILKRPVIDFPALGCLNLHGADLPNYGGLMPSFWMLRNEEPAAAATLFYITEEVDRGPIAAKRRFPVLAGETLHQFIRRSRREACSMVIEALGRIDRGEMVPEPMVGEGSYHGWPTREDYRRFRSARRRMG